MNNTYLDQQSCLLKSEEDHAKDEKLGSIQEGLSWRSLLYKIAQIKN